MDLRTGDYGRGAGRGGASDVVRLPGNRFAAIAREADRDGVALFDTTGIESRRLPKGLPERMRIDGLFADPDDNLYLIGFPRTQGDYSRGSSGAPVERSVWRLVPQDGIWTAYATIPSDAGTLVAVMRGGKLMTWHASTFDQHQFRTFTPATGWRVLPKTLVAGVGPGFARAGPDDLYVYAYDLPSMARMIVRISAESGVIERAFASVPSVGSTALATDPAGQLLAVEQAVILNSTETRYNLYRIDPREANASFQLLTATPGPYPYAPASDGSFLNLGVDSVPRFQRPGATAFAVGTGSLGPRSVCRGPTGASAISGPTGFTLCVAYSASYLDYADSARLQVPSNGFFYAVSGDGQSLVRIGANQAPGTPIASLQSALEPGFGSIYTIVPSRLLATADASRFFVLLHRYVNDDSIIAQLIEVDIAKKTVTSILMPAVLASDMALSPAGNLYVATRFGEVLRRGSDGKWSTYGHLSAAHADLHVFVDGAERVWVYGLDGIARAQGVGTRIDEFYHADLDHYFVTADAAESASLRNGAGGWTPTGVSVPAIAALPWTAELPYARPLPVCRFYGSVVPGPNSHFYTAVATECEGLKALQQKTPASEPRWNSEGIAFHTLTSFAGASCGPTEERVDRLFNGGASRGLAPNHRFVNDLATAASMLRSDWIVESAAWCVPNETYTRTFRR